MDNHKKSSKGLNIALWAAQAIIALMFIMPGFMKMFQPIQSLSEMLPWAGEVPAGVVRGLGLLDLLGGVGIILPSLLRFKPELTIWAAYGTILLMVSAIIFHLSRGEASVIGFNVFLIMLLAFIAWGRKSKAPIYAK